MKRILNGFKAIAVVALLAVVVLFVLAPGIFLIQIYGTGHLWVGIVEVVWVIFLVGAFVDFDSPY